MPGPTPAFSLPAHSRPSIHHSASDHELTFLTDSLPFWHILRLGNSILPCRAYLCQVHPIFHFWMSCQKPVMIITLRVCLQLLRQYFRWTLKLLPAQHDCPISEQSVMDYLMQPGESPCCPASTAAQRMPHAGLILKDSAPLTFRCSS